jgi:predicted permease
LWRGAYLAVVHLAMGLIVAQGLVVLFGFTGTERGVVILMAAMPVSAATYLWIERYTPDAAPDVAGYILVSTLLTAVALPPILAFLI